MAQRRRAGVWRWIGRGALAVLLLVVLVIAGGAGYEQWARSTARTRFPPPGKLVDVGGGRRIHLDCQGQGAPTVVLISGLDNNGALAWSAVRDRISPFARVCAYDRAGIMYSDPAPAAHDARLSTADLHAALKGAGETGPFVMVGHSLGGPYIDDYLHSYPADVAGVVFVDASVHREFGIELVVTFLASVLCLSAALVNFLRDIWVSLSALRLEVERALPPK